MTLTNAGNAPLQISDIGLGGADPGRFSISHDCPSSLDAGAACSVGVTFRPAAAGSSSATLIFVDDDQGNVGSAQRVVLTGSGTPAPVARVAPASLSFTTPTSTVSESQRVTLTNAGSANLTGVAVSVVGAHFTIVDTNCSSVLAPGADCVVDVAFSPPSAGGPFMATLRFSGDDPVQPTQEIALSGTAPDAPPPPANVAPPGGILPTVDPPIVRFAADTDKDGVLDLTDRCPATAGNLVDGCPSELNAEIRGLWRVNNLLSQLLTLTVRATVGSRIAMRCSNSRGRCGFSTRTIRKTTTRLTRLTRYFKPRRILPAGTVITVRVTRPMQIGSYKRLTTRRGRKLPRVFVRCLDAGTGHTRSCS